MAWVRTFRIVLVFLPLLVGASIPASGQSRSGSARSNPSSPQSSKLHDRNWLKTQVRRRYGTAALPDKTTSQTNEKRPASGDKSNQPPAKN
jgi:hypothetical protein